MSGPQDRLKKAEDQQRARKKLVDSGERCKRLEQELASARQTREAFVRDAVNAGLPKNEIADLAGVSRQTVYDILGAEE